MKSKAIARKALLWLLPAVLLAQGVAVTAAPAETAPGDGGASQQASGTSDPAGTAEGGSAEGGTGEVAEPSPAGERLAAMEQAAAAGDSALYFDPETGDIALQSRTSGAVWFSSPTGAASSAAGDALKDRLLSQIRVEMYDTQNKLVELYSYKDCVEKEQFEVTRIDNGIAVAMTLGQEEQRVLLPEAIPAASLETYVLPNLEGRALSRIQYFYRKYDAAEMEESQLAEMAERYPIVREQPIYVLRSVMDAEREELQGYMEEAGYTFEQMEKDLLAVGAALDEAAKPYVKLTVKYTLDEEGAFWAAIPCGEIVYDKASFSLSRLYLLEYFAASPRGQEGYILIPDGSGAVMRFNQDAAGTAGALSLPVYSNDMSLSFNSANVGRAGVRLPAYAIGDESGTLLCSIEQGEAQSVITAGSGGSDNPYAYVGAYLNFADTDSFDFQEVRQQNTMIVVDSNVYSQDYRLRYQPLDKGADYTDAAIAYREYLVEAGKLKKNSGSSGGLGLTVGLLGTVMHTERFLVFPIDRLIPLTSFEDAQAIATELLAEGIGTLDLRYMGWANGGLENKIYNKARVEGVLGGRKGLTQLAGFCEENEIRLYPDAELVTVARDAIFDGFSPKSDAARMLNKQYSQLQSMDNATNSLNRDNFRYLLNPLAAKEAYTSFAKSYTGLGIGNLSIGSAGSLLHSDKNEKNAVNRTQARDAVAAIFAAASESFGVMTEGGNAYTFPYADAIVNIEG